MSVEAIERSFRDKVAEQITLLDEGRQRYRVMTPFRFDDGDHLAIVLLQSGKEWVLSDEGHTYMHLTYRIDESDLQTGNRARLISNALNQFSIEDRDGELLLAIPDERYGDALFDYVQALLKITDLTYLSRERVQSTFIEDLRSVVEQRVPAAQLSVNWFDEARDPRGNYIVDYRIETSRRPLFVFALPNDDRVRDATITLQQYREWDVANLSIGVFEDQETVNRKVLARFSNACDKQFSSLEVPLIESYLASEIGSA